MAKKVLILGGNGFLGREIYKQFSVSDIYDVIVGDIGGSTKYQYIKINILDRNKLKSICKPFDIIINCIGQITNPINNCIELNSRGIDNLVNAVKDFRQKLVHISSIAVYGEALKVDENSPVNPDSIYGVIKYFAEYILMKELIRKRLTIIRLGNLYGENQKSGAIAYLRKNIKTHRKLKFDNDGTLLRYYLHVKDAARIIYEFVDKGPHQGIFNLIGPKPYSINEIINIIHEKIGKNINVVFKDKIPVSNIYNIDDKKIRKILNVKYDYDLEKFIVQNIND